MNDKIKSKKSLIQEFKIRSLNFILVLIVPLMLMSSCGNGNDIEDNNNILVVAVDKVKEMSQYGISQSYIGEVEAARKSRVGFEIGGMLKEISYDEGDLVQKGDILAILDTERLRARRAELAATRDQAQANLELAQITRQRTKEALDLNAVSFQEYDQADKDHKAKKASLEQAKSAVNSLDVDIEKSKLKAPFNSVISKRFLDEGEVIQPGEEVLEILERTNPQIRIGFSSSMVEEVNVEDEVLVTVNGTEYIARVKSVLPLRSQNTRTVDVILSLDKAFENVRHGDLATVTIQKSIPKNGFWLPMTALTESSRGLWSCYVAVPLNESEANEGASHKLDRRELELLHQESGRVFVRGTISEGDLVVSKGIQRLVNGLLVEINNPDELSEGTK